MKSLILALALVSQAAPLKAVTVTAPAPPPVAVTTVAPIASTPISSPLISGPTTIQEHTLTSFTVPGFDAVSWLVIPSISTDQTGGKLDITGPPGSYTLIAAVIQAGQPILLQQILTVQATPSPAASTAASSTPQAPTATALPLKPPGAWAFIVYPAGDGTTLAPGQLAIKDSQTIGTTLQALGVHLRQVTVNSDLLKDPKWEAALKGVTLPAYGVVDGASAPLIPFSPLPTDQATLVAAITKALPAK